MGAQPHPHTVTRIAEGPVVRPVSRKAAPQTTRPGPSAERDALFRRRRRHPDEPGQFAVALVIIYRTLGQLLPEHYDPDRRSLRYGRPRGHGEGPFLEGSQAFHKSKP